MEEKQTAMVNVARQIYPNSSPEQALEQFRQSLSDDYFIALSRTFNTSEKIKRSSDRVKMDFFSSGDTIITDKRPARPKVLIPSMYLQILERAGYDGMAQSISFEYPKNVTRMSFDSQAALMITDYLLTIKVISALETLPPLSFRSTRACVPMTVSSDLETFNKMQFKSDDILSLASVNSALQLTFTYTPTFEFRNVGLTAATTQAVIDGNTAGAYYTPSESVENIILPDIFTTMETTRSKLRTTYKIVGFGLTATMTIQCAGVDPITITVVGANATATNLAMIAAINANIILNKVIIANNLAGDLEITTLAFSDIYITSGYIGYTIENASGSILASRATLNMLQYGTSEVLPIGPRIFTFEGGVELRATLTPLNPSSMLGKLLTASKMRSH